MPIRNVDPRVEPHLLLAMQPATPLLLTFLVIGGGRIAEGNDPVFTSRMIVGGTIVVLGVAMANVWSRQLANAFAILLLVVAFLRYGLSLMRAVGFQVGGASNGGS